MPMPADSHSILDQLALVNRERSLRAADPELAAAVVVLKHYQQQRFCHTYADLLSSARYAAAARFFLDELYGPRDFSERDAQFARVVPAMVRLFPQEIVDTVDTLARLHALSESLDTKMAALLRGVTVDARRYLFAWQRCDERDGRARQIDLTLDIGAALDRLTRRPFLRRTLHMMRRPARAAGLAALQQFLESGFDTFAAMRGSDEFLAMVGHRERELIVALFDSALPLEIGSDDPSDPRLQRALRQLP
jgi:hypothetical protein